MNDETSMQGRVCLISGGTSGIGKAAARGLARLGARIVLLCRNADRGTQALEEISRETGNRLGEVLVGDLSLTSSVRRAAAEFHDRFDRLDVPANLDDLQLERNYGGMAALAQTLYARLSFAFEPADRLEGSGVTSTVFHPGAVRSRPSRLRPPGLGQR